MQLLALHAVKKKKSPLLNVINSGLTAAERQKHICRCLIWERVCVTCIWGASVQIRSCILTRFIGTKILKIDTRVELYESQTFFLPLFVCIFFSTCSDTKKDAAPVNLFYNVLNTDSARQMTFTCLQSTSSHVCILWPRVNLNVYSVNYRLLLKK